MISDYTNRLFAGMGDGTVAIIDVRTSSRTLVLEDLLIYYTNDCCSGGCGGGVCVCV